MHSLSPATHNRLDILVMDLPRYWVLTILLHNAATGFKFFPTFGGNNEGETLQSSLRAPVKNLNCISSILELFTGKLTGNEPGN